MSGRRGLPMGGQALPNGVMMRSRSQAAIAMRCADGRIVTDRWQFRPVNTADKPILRGICQLFASAVFSFRTFSRAGRLLKACGEPRVTPSGIANTAAVAALTGLYALASDSQDNLLRRLLPDASRCLLMLAAGAANLLLLSLTLFLLSLVPAVRRMLKYHGAEHKAIACYEQGLDMTAGNVRRQIRFHRRCGTSMAAFVVLAGVAATVLMPPYLGEAWQELLLCACLLFAAGIVYESMRSQKSTPLSAIGLAAQRLTTLEPDDAMLECAIAAAAQAAGEDEASGDDA